MAGIVSDRFSHILSKFSSLMLVECADHVCAAAILTRLSPYFPSFIYLLGCMWPLGLTMMLSLASDLLSAITASLYGSYLVATGIFRVQLAAVGSLWRLFRGILHECRHILPLSHRFGTRQATKCSTESHRFMGLRYGSVAIGNDPFHTTCFPLPNRWCLLPLLCPGRYL